MRKMIILTEGMTSPQYAKTAMNLIKYKPEEVLALFDSTTVGESTKLLLGTDTDIPIINDLSLFPDANTLLLGVATSGGIYPPEWRKVIIQAINQKMNIISGLHSFISDDPEFIKAANENHVELIDIRKNSFRKIVTREGFNNSCLRIQTVGNDCSLGKMITSLEIALDLKKLGKDAKFVATGQTGILIEGDGIPIDAVVGDFINGAAEQLVLSNQHHDILIIEGQASIIQPRYSSVTLGLLHGAMPQGLIMCYEMGRENTKGLEHIKIPPLKDVIDLYEKMSNIMFPCKVIGIAINGRKYTKKEVDFEQNRIKEEFGLPACDVIKHSPRELTNAILRIQEEEKKTLL